jgi:Sigma-70 region 2
VLFDRHFAAVYRYLRRRVGDEQAIELAAETFLQAFRSRRRFTGGGGQGLSSTQTLIRAGTRITREINLSSNCAGAYHGTVLYQPSLGPAGQEGTGLLRAGAPGTYLVGRFSITVP